MPIPLVDLKAQYASIKDEIDSAMAHVIAESAFIGGKYAAQFEREFAAAHDAQFCVGVGNGTDALFLVLKALGIGDGDEVLVPANTFIATSEAVTATGAHVVFVDVDPDDALIDITAAKEAVTAKTKAIIAVHLYGQPAPLEELLTLTKEKEIHLVEDAAQAHLAEYKGKKIGTMGVASTFSFYPGKNLGAYGDAGAIMTNDEALAATCRKLANHGRAAGEKYNHAIEGHNSRLDGLQAAILSVKLKYLSEWTERRQEVAKQYREALGGITEVILPKEFPERAGVYHLFVVRARERDKLKEHLKEAGIETGIHYPIGLPKLDAYKHFAHAHDDFPVTHQLATEILSLPMYPELTKEQIKHITNSIKQFYVSR